MKRFAFVVAMVVLVSGCAHNVHEPVTAYQAPQPLPKKCEQAPCDNFDKAGEIVGDGSRKMWNYTTQAWEWVTSEENKERAARAWQATKDAAVKGYEAGKESYNEHK